MTTRFRAILVGVFLTSVGVGWSVAPRAQIGLAPGARQLAALAPTAAVVVAEARTFTEVASAAALATYTGSVTVPPESTLLDVQVRSAAAWNDGTAAAMDCGDSDAGDGFYDGLDLTTAVLSGEAVTFEHPVSAGAYLATDARDFYRPLGTVVACVATVTDGDGSAGETHLLVVYATVAPVAVVPVDP